jgi:hypothetical protein
MLSPLDSFNKSLGLFNGKVILVNDNCDQICEKIKRLQSKVSKLFDVTAALNFKKFPKQCCTSINRTIANDFGFHLVF